MESSCQNSESLVRNFNLLETFLSIAQSMYNTAGYGKMHMALYLFQQWINRIVETVSEYHIV